MTINQLKYIIAVSKYSSIREASEKLFLSQPALSSAIQELEEEIGVLIFERTNKGTVVTPEGREFINFAQMAVNQYGILEDRYLSRDREKERFSVSTLHYNFAVHAFTNMIRKFDLSQFVFSIYETRTNEVFTNVRDMKSEVGIVSYSQGNENVIRKILNNYHLEFIPLMKKETYIYVWKDHELANEQEVSLGQLTDYPCVVFEQNNEGDFYLHEEALGNYNFPKLIRSDDRATSMEIIARLNGYSIGSGMLAEENAVLKGMVSIKLKEEDPLTIGYIFRKDSKLSPYGKSFIEELEKYREL